MELYIIIIAVIIAVGILVSFVTNAKSAKKNISGIIVMALAGICAVLFMLFGFVFSSFTVYLLFIILVAVLLFMVFLLMQYFRVRKEKTARAYANGNASGAAVRPGIRIREESSVRSVSSGGHSLEESDLAARKIFVAADLNAEKDQDGLYREQEPAEEVSDAAAVPFDMETFEAAESVQNEEESQSEPQEGYLPESSIDIADEPLQEASAGWQALEPDESKSAAQPFEPIPADQALETAESREEEPEATAAESARESVYARNTAQETIAEEMTHGPVQNQAMPAEETGPEELQETAAETSAEFKSIGMQLEETGHEEWRKIAEEPSATAEWEPLEVQSKEIIFEESKETAAETSEEFKSIGRRLEETGPEELQETAEQSAELESFETRQDTENGPEEGQAADKTAVTADTGLTTAEKEEEIHEEISSVPEETDRVQSILQKAAGLKEQGKYLVACSLFKSAAQNAHNAQHMKNAEFQMLDCLVLAGQTEDAGRVMFGILNKKYNLTAEEKNRLKETMIILQYADRQKTV